MTSRSGSGGFSSRRARSFSRMSAYTLLALLLVSLPIAFLPFPAGDPARLLAVLRELLERSTLSVVGTALLFTGLEAPALPALWECWPQVNRPWRIPGLRSSCSRPAVSGCA